MRTRDKLSIIKRFKEGFSIAGLQDYYLTAITTTEIEQAIRDYMNGELEEKK